MDRCRCREYAAAVEKIKFYTVGTFRPDIIDNYDRSDYQVVWVNNRINLADFRTSKPRALKVMTEQELEAMELPKNIRKIEQMWCPYMTPYVLKN